jgi:hypothetical protein
MSNKVCAEIVVDPGLLDLRLHLLHHLKIKVGRHQADRAVAAASISTLERMGIVLRRSTTDWTWLRLFKQRCAFDGCLHSLFPLFFSASGRTPPPP